MLVGMHVIISVVIVVNRNNSKSNNCNSNNCNNNNNTPRANDVNRLGYGECALAGAGLSALLV